MSKEKFVSVIFKSIPKESLILMLCDFFKGLIGNYINPIYNDRVLTVFFDAACEIDFEEIIQSLNEDFYVTATLFESGELYDGIDKNEYSLYIFDNKNKLLETNKLYVSEADLIKHKIISSIVAKNILKEYYDDYQMKNVIKTYLDCNMNISKAANKLYMHRNTVMNKIDKFILNTGYDIKKFKNAFIIYHII